MERNAKTLKLLRQIHINVIICRKLKEVLIYCINAASVDSKYLLDTENLNSFRWRKCIKLPVNRKFKLKLIWNKYSVSTVPDIQFRMN